MIFLYTYKCQARSPSKAMSRKLRKCALFPDFQLAFVNCVNETIVTMLKDGNAHTEVHDAPKFKLPPYSDFHGDVPKSAWVFLEGFQKTLETSVCIISVSKEFKDLVDFQLILNPLLEQQLGLIGNPLRLGTIPFSEKALHVAETKQQKDAKFFKLIPVYYLI